MDAIMLHGMNPEQLQQMIDNSVKSQIDTLKKEYAPKEPNEFLSRAETMAMLKISAFCLHNWMNKGILKPKKVGNRTYFLRSDIEDKLMNSNK